MECSACGDGTRVSAQSSSSCMHPALQQHLMGSRRHAVALLHRLRSSAQTCCEARQTTPLVRCCPPEAEPRARGKRPGGGAAPTPHSARTPRSGPAWPCSGGPCPACAAWLPPRSLPASCACPGTRRACHSRQTKAPGPTDPAGSVRLMRRPCLPACRGRGGAPPRAGAERASHGCGRRRRAAGQAGAGRAARARAGPGRAPPGWPRRRRWSAGGRRRSARRAARPRAPRPARPARPAGSSRRGSSGGCARAARRRRLQRARGSAVRARRKHG